MFTPGKPKFLLSTEEKEMVTLQAEITELTDKLNQEKLHHDQALTSEKEKSNKNFFRGRKAERKRIAAIRKLPEFSGREDIAFNMALNESSNIEPQALGALLRNIPKQEKAVAGNPFVEHMNALGNPMIGADFDTENESEHNNTLEGIAKGAI